MLVKREELTTYWERVFGVVPWSPGVRTGLKGRWFRMYSLPEGKRYAEMRKEQRLLLQRHNRLMASLFAGEEKVVMLTMGYSEDEEP